MQPNEAKRTASTLYHVACSVSPWWINTLEHEAEPRADVSNHRKGDRKPMKTLHSGKADFWCATMLLTICHYQDVTFTSLYFLLLLLTPILALLSLPLSARLMNCWFAAVWCDVMWCDVMWCDVMWCDVMWCAWIWFDVMWCDVIRCNLMRCDMRHAPCRHAIWYMRLWYVRYLMRLHFFSCKPANDTRSIHHLATKTPQLESFDVGHSPNVGSKDPRCHWSSPVNCLQVELKPTSPFPRTRVSLRR